jgi:hypothetical protein
LSKSQLIPLALEEVAQVRLRTKLVLLMLFVLVDMSLKLVLTLQPNKTFQDGLCQKLEDPIMTQRNLIEIRLTTLGPQLVNNAIQKIHQLELHTLALLVEKLRRGWAHSKIRCKVDKA